MKKWTCLRLVVGCSAVAMLVATTRAAVLPGEPAIVKADFNGSSSPGGAGMFDIINLGQSPISSATIDLSTNPAVAFETPNGTTNPVSVNPLGSHGIDATALSPQPTLTGTIGNSNTLFPILNLSFKPNSFNPGSILAFDIPVVKLGANDSVLSTPATGQDLVGGLASITTAGGETATGSLFAPPPGATTDTNTSLALLTSSSALSTGGQETGTGVGGQGVPEPGSLLVWSLLGLCGTYGLLWRKAHPVA